MGRRLARLELAPRSEVPQLGRAEFIAKISAGTDFCSSSAAHHSNSRHSFRYRRALGHSQVRSQHSGMGLMAVGLDQGRNRIVDHWNDPDLDSLRRNSQLAPPLVVLFLARFIAARRISRFPPAS